MTMNAFSHVPPGFRFHPTDEELVDFYLRNKVTSRRIDLNIIKDVDLYRIEPWDLQDLCKVGDDDQNEWFFFSHKDKKYPTGTRTNRATTAGFWKATGRDKAIYSKHDLIGMRKTLVFYKGRAPNGQKSDYIMHEYRLETDENATPQEEGWVVCRVFKKRIPNMRKIGEHDSPMWYDDNLSFMQENMDSPRLQYPSPCKKEVPEIPLYHQSNPIQHFFHLPLLETTKAGAAHPVVPPPTNMPVTINSSSPAFGLEVSRVGSFQASVYAFDQALPPPVGTNPVATDWRVLDKFVASQLMSQEDVSKENDYTNGENHGFKTCLENNEEIVPENASTTPSSSCPIDMWK